MKGIVNWNRSGRDNKWLVILAALLVGGLLVAGCGGGSADAGSMKDPYEAYGLKKGDDNLAFAILDNPPKAIAIQPVLLQKAYHKDATLAIEPMVFERGDSKSFSFDMTLVHDEGDTYPLRATVDMKYLGGDDELFEIDTDTYGYATLVRKGIYYNELGQHTVKGRSTSFSSFGGDPETYLSFGLGVDKKDAERADGSVALIYCKIVGVKR